jgi:serine/threonine protein kinase
MFQEGDTASINGDEYELGRPLGTGGYGEAWAARRRDDKRSLVIKRFFKFRENDILRMEALRDFQLSSRLGGATSVSEVIYPQGTHPWAGYIMPWALGIGLDEWLEERDFNVLDNILVTAQIAKLLSDAHQLGISHGDTHPRNVKIYLHNDTPVVTLIDWDNASIPNLPPPRSPGAKHFFSPESMQSFLGNEKYPPDIRTELSSVPRVFHWLLFGREAFQTADEDEFEQETVRGSWNSDPADGLIDTNTLGGIPNQWISPEIADLFRRGLGPDRDNRPSMSEWLAPLQNVIEQGISLCQACNGPVFLAPRLHCPFCGNPFPTLVVVSRDGHRFAANGEPVLIGRANVSSPGLSQRHCVIVKLGPETFVTDLGSKNGTYRRAKDRWIRLPARLRSPIQAGDRLRCGDVEFFVVNS